MVKLKTISCLRSSDVEDVFNKWIEQTKCEIIQIQYSEVPMVDYEDPWASVMILYKPNDDE